MKYWIIFLLLPCENVFAQMSDANLMRSPNVTIHKDYRLNILAKKQAEMNTAILKNKARTQKGYRLMILNTNDKDYAFKVRSDLMTRYPDHKPYMWYANPYIRLKFGNFKTKEEAERYQKEISRMLNGARIYLLYETIEVDPGEDFDPDSMRDRIQ